MRILVVEDEPLLAMLLEESLADLGHEAIGAAATADQALALIEAQDIDGALLDFSLGQDATSVVVAQRLVADGTPFYYLSGHASVGPDDGAPPAPLLTKPLSLADLKDALQAIAVAA